MPPCPYLCVEDPHIGQQGGSQHGLAIHPEVGVIGDAVRDGGVEVLDTAQ